MSRNIFLRKKTKQKKGFKYKLISLCYIFENAIFKNYHKIFYCKIKKEIKQLQINYIMVHVLKYFIFKIINNFEIYKLKLLQVKIIIS